MDHIKDSLVILYDKSRKLRSSFSFFFFLSLSIIKYFNIWKYVRLFSSENKMMNFQVLIKWISTHSKILFECVINISLFLLALLLLFFFYFLFFVVVPMLEDKKEIGWLLMAERSLYLFFYLVREKKTQKNG